MNKRLFRTFIFLFALSPLLSYDASTPQNGNLYQENSGSFNPAKVFSYKDPSILDANGLTLNEGRISKETTTSLSDFYNYEDLHRGSNISWSNDGYGVVLTGNTGRYNHSIFGANNNATGFLVVKDNNIIASYTVERNRVIETKRALIADIIPENDGNEILLTVSDDTGGARIEVFSYDGRKLGSSDSIGLSHRWMHVLAVAPFDNAMEPIIAVVKTPHIGGVLQFYKWNGNKLEIIYRLNGISTHLIGSDNLNMAVAADFDGDPESIELIVPTSNYRTLLVIKYSGENWIVINKFDLPGRLNTNILLTNDTKKSLWLGTNNNYIIQITE